MEDRTTPHLQAGRDQAALTGNDFWAGREAQLQARLDEVEAELATQGDVPEDLDRLEQQAMEVWRSLSELLKPLAPAPVPTLPAGPTPAPAPLFETDPGGNKADGRRRPWQAVGIVALLLVAALAALGLTWEHGAERDNNPTVVAVRALATATRTLLPPAPTTSSPTRPPATATPLPSPTPVAPVINGTPGQATGIVRAERVQILDTSGVLHLELPLAVMAEAVQKVEGQPVLRPLLPASGAGVHRDSVAFGQADRVAIAISPGAAPAASLRQTRPGDQISGCNSDRTCHRFQVVAADTWPTERLCQLLRSTASYAVASRQPGGFVLLYTVLDESSAWVVQAQALDQEDTR